MIDTYSDFNNLRFFYDKEHLDEVFATKLDLYPSIKKPVVSGNIILYELLRKIKYNLNVEVLLTPKYYNYSRNDAYDKLKLCLEAVCYNATYDGYKNLDNLKSITNLMFLDLDDFDNIEEAKEYKDFITLKYEWIVACFLSSSRLGLHIIILVDKIFNNADFNKKYDIISAEYFENKLDKNGKSLTRYSIIPFDYDIYVNETPKILDIDNIISTNEKGISSGLKKEKIISTEYTFSEPSQLNSSMNAAVRNDGLRFRIDIDEKHFTDPNQPIYIHEGIDTIEVNLFPYRNKKVKKGIRTITLGAITIQMIYLNAQSPEYTDPEIKNAILKFIMSLNNKICDPPLKYIEVLNSFNANWQRYEKKELDISPFFKKKYAFWSSKCTLKANEKRQITCRIKNEPLIAESRKKIEYAIDQLHSERIKITQKKVEELSGLSLPTVKKYWRDYKQRVKQINESR